MASIDFPASPTTGQQYTAAGVTWVWDGTKWTPAGASTAVVQAMNDNRIINGDMRIDQRGVASGAGVTATGYTVDRWTCQLISSRVNIQRAASTCPGFPYALQITSSSAYTAAASDYFSSYQAIEADVVSDFQWGTASAQPATLSFWAFSSLTGSFGATVCNYAGTRSYPFVFSLPTANVWTKITVTIPGDTGGTWVTSGNGAWGIVNFDLGSGSTYRGPANAWASANYLGTNGTISIVAVNGASLQITGVKLEIGSIATPFNRQSLAKSMADCQRYYQSLGAVTWGVIATAGSQYFAGDWFLPVPMRVAPTMQFVSTSYNNSSGIAANGVYANAINAVAIASGAGAAFCTTSFSLSAEL